MEKDKKIFQTCYTARHRLDDVAILKKPQALEILHIFHLKAEEGEKENIPNMDIH